MPTIQTKSSSIKELMKILRLHIALIQSHPAAVFAVKKIVGRYDSRRRDDVISIRDIDGNIQNMCCVFVVLQIFNTSGMHFQ